MSKVLYENFKKSFKRGLVGYFAPVIAAERIYKRRRWNYFHQLRVVYRYVFWK